MKIIYTLRATILPIIFLLFASCDPMNYYQQVVSNQSQSEIVVVRYNKSTSSVSASVIDSTFIIANNQGVIFRRNGLGGFGSNNNCKYDIVDSISTYVRNNSSLKVVKDLNNSDNWMYSRSGNSRKGYNTQCKATITNSDIVPK